MDKRIEELIDYTKTTLGLDSYYLQTYTLHRRRNIFNKTVYILCMEWIPGHITKRVDEDLNPDGTAVIEIDVNSRRFASVIFVGEKSYANKITLQCLNTDGVIQWIEKETSLSYGIRFQLEKKENREYHFQACMDRIAVLPFGSIEVKFDHNGKLLLFAIYGPFPAKEIIEKETYVLTLKDVEQLSRKQLKLIEYPSDEEKRFIPVYCIEEIYIPNNQTLTIPFEFNVDGRLYIQINKKLCWETPINKPFERTEMKILEDISVEQAFSCEPHPDTFPITTCEQEKCITAVEDFLRQVYPNDTGKWILKTFHRESGYIQAILKPHHQDDRLFQRNITVMIDANNYTVINYLDNQFFLDMFHDFTATKKITINRDEAYEKIRPFIGLKPIYVYDMKQKKYMLCGKIDCQFGVHATNGEVISLNDL